MSDTGWIEAAYPSALDLDDHLHPAMVAGRAVFLRLVGRGANRDAIGARVEAVVGGRVHLRLPGAAGSFLSSDDVRLHVGLGAAERVDLVRVTWPDGVVEEFGPYEVPESGETLVLRRSD